MPFHFLQNFLRSLKRLIQVLGSISNYDDDAKDNVDYKMNLYILPANLEIL